MGARGPSPKPTLLKVIAGNPGCRPLNTGEPIPAPMDPSKVPAEVASIPAALDIWTRLVPDLASCGLARSVDWTVLARYCIKLARWFYLAAEIDRRTREDAGSAGANYSDLEMKRREYPFVGEWRALDRELRLDESRLGISPASRSRITVPGREKTEDELRRDFFAGGPGYKTGA